jgi:asparagine synthase (glutamine-hydrolysing)
MSRSLRKIRYKLRRLFSPPLREIIVAVRNDKLSYLSKAALEDLYKRVCEIEKKELPGMIIEAGCALGGSAIVMAMAKSVSRPMFVYDVFGMIPPPTDNDGEDVQQRYNEIVGGNSEGIKGERYYGYEDNLCDKVVENFARHDVPVQQNNVHLVKGLFEDTLKVEGPVALAHIDGDWYSSVMVCLEQIEPKLVSGGVMVIDDYKSWSGCRKAVDEYFADKKALYRFQYKSRLHIIKR